MKHRILNCWNGSVIAASDYGTFAELVGANRAVLRGAVLRGAVLSGADLSGTALGKADRVEDRR